MQPFLRTDGGPTHLEMEVWLYFAVEVDVLNLCLCLVYCLLNLKFGLLRELLKGLSTDLLYALLVQLIILLMMLGPAEAPVLGFAHFLVVYRFVDELAFGDDQLVAFSALVRPDSRQVFLVTEALLRANMVLMDLLILSLLVALVSGIVFSE